MNEYALGAKMIRQWLKAQGIAGRVTSEGYSMGSSINVVIEDQPPAIVAKVNAYTNQFQYGHFDSMQDLYEYSNNRPNLPQAKYVFVRNNLSDELRQEIWDFARGYYNVLGDAPADQKDLGNYRIADWNMWGSDLIYRLAQGGFNQNEFWDFKAEQAIPEAA